MKDKNNQVQDLIGRLNVLLKRQETFQKEIDQIKNEISNLVKTEEALETKEVKPGKSKFVTLHAEEEKPKSEVKEIPDPFQFVSQKTFKSNFEEFIGGNVINKIGVLATIIGVVIGVKYAIDNELINPLTRIILGYILGLGFLGFAIKLKTKYKTYSAVLLSGSMAISYIVTFFAYHNYQLIPQAGAFVLMSLFTAFTVFASLYYNRQVIGHIGLVGAYAVPFLLSSGSGKAAILFSYMTIVNSGILFLSFKKYWKSLYYSAFGLTWFIFFYWYVTRYATDHYFTLGLIFVVIFFIIFYLSFLAYKVLQREKFKTDDVLMLLANAFIFYGFGYNMLANHSTGSNLLGIFTLFNAFLHFAVSWLIYKDKLIDKNLILLLSALVITFITITIPVQLEGNWVTLMWIAQASILFWLGRTKQVKLYEQLAYPTIILAVISILHDWMQQYYGIHLNGDQAAGVLPFFNITFLTALLFAAGLAFINYINYNKAYKPFFSDKPEWKRFVNYSLAFLFIGAVYFTFNLELSFYWTNEFNNSKIVLKTAEPYSFPRYDYDIHSFKNIWLLNYSALFFTLLAFLNIKKIKNQTIANVNLVIMAFVLFLFLTRGLYSLSELRESYLTQSLSQYYNRGIFNIIIRYITFVIMGGLIYYCFAYIKQEFMKLNLKVSFNLTFTIVLFWILSSELIHWLHFAGFEERYKLGLSLFWGLYALPLIVLGIRKNLKYLRVTAMVILGIAFGKTFVYDIVGMDTDLIAVLITSVGIIFIVASFLYIKYKTVLYGKTKN